MGAGNKYRRKTEGGSGGRRGHSNMEHWEHTASIKDGSRRERRRQDAAESLRGIWSWMTKEEADILSHESDRDIDP
jgi:hypothetical protein